MTRFLPDLDTAAILASHGIADPAETAAAKFDLPESTAALTANALGRFLGERAGDLPPLPGLGGHWPATAVTLQAEIRSPIAGLRLPKLDARIDLADRLIGVHAARYAPFRPSVWKAYDKALLKDWGKAMAPWMQIRDAIQSRRAAFRHVDAATLSRQALALAGLSDRLEKPALLLYLYASPAAWPDGTPIPEARHKSHLDEIETLVAHSAKSALPLVALRWEDLVAQWAGEPTLAAHAGGLRDRFAL